MPDVRIVAKAMNDLADDWHWVLLIEAEELEPRVFYAGRVKTVCGLPISDVPRVVRLFDMGAPQSPTCPRCLDDGMSPGLRAALEEALETAEVATTEVSTPA